MVTSENTPPAATCSNGIRELDELPLQVEAIRESRGQRLHAEALGRVVAGGDERDPELAGEVKARLLRLAGQEQVEARRGRLREVAAAAARDDRNALDLVRAFLEDQRLGRDPFPNACEERFDRSPVQAAGRRRRSRRTARRPLPRARARAARCCRPPDGRRARGGSRRGSDRRRTAPPGGRGRARRSHAARCPRAARGARSRAARAPRPRARTARATRRRRRRSSTPPPPRPPACPAARSRGTCRDRAAPPRSPGSRRAAPSRAIVSAARVPCSGSGCGAAW